MAKVLGEFGRYASQEATRRSPAIGTLAIITMSFIGTGFGFLVRSSFPVSTLAPLSRILLAVAVLLVLWLVGSLAFYRLAELEQQRESLRKGAARGKSVADTLSELPDEFWVVNDVAAPAGNLDHVVIGPTGVFLIKAMDCRGIIGADGEGEMTLNGKPAATAHVKKFIGSVLATKERVRVLAPGVEPFFKAVMVFTSARVEVKFGATGRQTLLATASS